jgi:hypothetical protein
MMMILLMLFHLPPTRIQKAPSVPAVNLEILARVVIRGLLILLRRQQSMTSMTSSSPRKRRSNPDHLLHRHSHRGKIPFSLFKFSNSVAPT